MNTVSLSIATSCNLVLFNLFLIVTFLPLEKKAVEVIVCDSLLGSEIGDAYLRSADSLVPKNGTYLFCTFKFAREDNTEGSTSSTKDNKLDRLYD